ncbi:MAG: Ig-like domain-containing protein, partial [Longimicrobiales bacterium]
MDGCPVSWASDDEDVATVDDEGMLTGLAEGQVTITATVRGVSGS